MPNVLLFSLATCGYHWKYQQNIASHKQYAKKYHYQYSVVDRPLFSTEGLDIVWLKLFLLKRALNKNYDWIVLLDADTKIQTNCPPIESVDVKGKYVYAANGYSNRINSGVLILKNSIESRDLIDTIVAHCDQPVALEDDVGWGENGHVIRFLKDNDGVQLLDSRWKNNHNPILNDYIRHYSAGPIQHLYHTSFINLIKFSSINICLRITRKLLKLFVRKKINLTDRMNTICNASLSHHPIFGKY